MPFVTGYGVDIALLLDAYRWSALPGWPRSTSRFARTHHQPLRDLSPMASAVLEAVSTRLAREGRLRVPPPEAAVERPPISSLRVAA